ncbi:MAG: NYN domain-containing protein [Methanomassiliicoccales archaeon]
MQREVIITAEENIAIYLDLENLAIAAEKIYPRISKPLAIDLLMDYAASHGNVCIKRAYADWAIDPCRSYAQDLASYAFDMIHLPGLTRQGKNGADLRMTMDALDDLQSLLTVDKFIIGSGDTDFIHLIRKIQQTGKKVVVMGFMNSVGINIRDNCNEFKAIEELMGSLHAPKEKQKKEKDDIEGEDGRDLLVRYIRANSKQLEGGVDLSVLKMDLKRLQPSFSERRYHQSSFSAFIKSFQGDLVEKVEGESGGGGVTLAFFKDWSDVAGNVDAKAVNDYLEQNLKVERDRDARLRMTELLISIFHRNPEPSINDITDEMFAEMGKKVPKKTIKAFVLTFGEGRLFHFSETEYTGDKFTMPQKLNDEIPSVEEIDEVYKRRLTSLVRNKFPGAPLDLVQRLIDEGPAPKPA